MNEGYKSRAFNLAPKKPKQKHVSYTCKDFVDPMKEIEGSSDEEDLVKKAKSKAAREQLVSVDPTEPDSIREKKIAKMERQRRQERRKALQKVNPYKDDDLDLEDDLKSEEGSQKRHGDSVLNEINEYQEKTKGRKKKKKFALKKNAPKVEKKSEDEKMDDEAPSKSKTTKVKPSSAKKPVLEDNCSNDLKDEGDQDELDKDIGKQKKKSVSKPKTPKKGKKASPKVEEE